jgi:hypothetical protein
MSADDVIRASEIASYGYCARAWWLGQVQGVPSTHGARMRAGTGHHRAHGRRVTLAIWLRRLGTALLLLACLALAALLWLWVRG